MSESQPEPDTNPPISTTDQPPEPEVPQETQPEEPTPPPVSSEPVLDVQDQQILSILTERLDNYKNLLSKKAPTTSSQHGAAKLFVSIVGTVLSHPTQPVFDHMWVFFTENKDGVANYGTALQGVDSLSPQDRFKVEVFYTLFRRAMSGIDVGDPRKTTRDFVAKLSCPPLVVYLQSKAKIVAAMALQNSFN